MAVPCGLRGPGAIAAAPAPSVGLPATSRSPQTLRHAPLRASSRSIANCGASRRARPAAPLGPCPLPAASRRGPLPPAAAAPASLPCPPPCASPRRPAARAGSSSAPPSPLPFPARGRSTSRPPRAAARARGSSRDASPSAESSRLPPPPAAVSRAGERAAEAAPLRLGLAGSALGAAPGPVLSAASSSASLPPLPSLASQLRAVSSIVGLLPSSPEGREAFLASLPEVASFLHLSAPGAAVRSHLAAEADVRKRVALLAALAARQTHLFLHLGVEDEAARADAAEDGDQRPDEGLDGRDGRDGAPPALLSDAGRRPPRVSLGFPGPQTLSSGASPGSPRFSLLTPPLPLSPRLPSPFPAPAVGPPASLASSAFPAGGSAPRLDAGLSALSASLLAVEEGYASIGGVLGYHETSLRFLLERQVESGDFTGLAGDGTLALPPSARATSAPIVDLSPIAPIASAADLSPRAPIAQPAARARGSAVPPSGALPAPPASPASSPPSPSSKGLLGPGLPPGARVLPPPFLDLEARDAPARRAAEAAVVAGLAAVPELAEVWTVGGAASRLGLVCERTGRPLPAAMLPYAGRTLLESLARDLEAREYLFWRVATDVWEESRRFVAGHEAGEEREAPGQGAPPARPPAAGPSAFPLPLHASSSARFASSASPFARYASPSAPRPAQPRTPVVMMTSDANDGHALVTALLEASAHFGRGRDRSIVLRQPGAPVVGAKTGRWVLKGPAEPATLPGGHGALWTLLRETGTLERLATQLGRSAALVRQIGNPLAGVDGAMLALAGVGRGAPARPGGPARPRAFGFAACPQAPGASEGVDALLEFPDELDAAAGRSGEQQAARPPARMRRAVVNVEYTAWERGGARPGPEFPANANVLYADLARVAGALDAAAERGDAERLLPGLAINPKNAVEDRCPLSGASARVKAGRLEAAMQAISVAFSAEAGEWTDDGFCAIHGDRGQEAGGRGAEARGQEANGGDGAHRAGEARGERAAPAGARALAEGGPAAPDRDAANALPAAPDRGVAKALPAASTRSVVGASLRGHRRMSLAEACGAVSASRLPAHALASPSGHAPGAEASSVSSLSPLDLSLSSCMDASLGAFFSALHWPTDGAGSPDCGARGAASSPADPSSYDSLDTFCVRTARRKLTSSAKRRAKPGAGADGLRQTPEGSFLDAMANARDVLRLGNWELPPEATVLALDDVAQAGVDGLAVARRPPLLVDLHPCLGPLWRVVASKVRRGRLARGAELRLEVAEADLCGVEVEGSLLIDAERVVGPMTGGDEERGEGEDAGREPAGPRSASASASVSSFSSPLASPSAHRVFSSACGRVRLHDVRVRNAGVDWSAPGSEPWSRRLTRPEACRVRLLGASEFDARDVSFDGPVSFVVPHGHRMVVRPSASAREGYVCVLLRLGEGRGAGWRWVYGLDEHGRIDVAMREGGTAEAAGRPSP